MKVEGISKWSKLTCVKEVQSFLGFVNFYRRFIEGFAGIARPLHDLTRKDIVWTWDLEHDTVFEALKLSWTCHRSRGMFGKVIDQRPVIGQTKCHASREDRYLRPEQL